MIILSAGMPRAGSGWYYNLTHELALAAGFQDAHQIRKKYHLQSILTEVNCNVGALTARRLLFLMLPSLLGNTFVVKAHAAPHTFALWLIQKGTIRPAYIYRDPRDAMLSAFENGQRAIQKGRPNAFSHLVDFDAALQFILEYLRIWEAWMACNQALHTRFEDLLGQYDVEVDRLIRFLNVPKKTDAVQAVLEKYRPANAKPDEKGLHFNQGRTGRFREKFTVEEQQRLAEALKPYLLKMGYEI